MRFGSTSFVSGRASARLLEGLEGRRLLAGNVAASLGEVFELRGDDAGNSVRITQTNGTTTILGLDGTTINGRPSVTTTTRPEKLDVKLFGGDDRLEVIGLRTSVDQNIEMDQGNDAVMLRGVSAGVNISVKTGDGVDSVGASSVRTGGDLFIETGEGTSSVGVAFSVIGKTLTTIGGDSRDLVSIFNTRTSEDLNVELKKGDDRADLVSVTSWKNIKVDADNGNDYVRVQNVFAASDAVFLGGDGFDTFENRGVRGGEKLEIKEFDRFV